MAVVFDLNSKRKLIDEGLIVKDGVKSVAKIGGKTALEVYTFPAQGKFDKPVELSFCHKAFCDWIIEAGIDSVELSDAMAVLEGDVLTENMVETIVNDYKVAYKNYEILNSGMVVCITGYPIERLSELEVKREEVATPDPEVG